MGLGFDCWDGGAGRGGEDGGGEGHECAEDSHELFSHSANAWLRAGKMVTGTKFRSGLSGAGGEIAVRKFEPVTTFPAWSESVPAVESVRWGNFLLGTIGVHV